MNKTVLTFSWLAKRAMSLHKRDMDEYCNLINDGSLKLVRGLRVCLQRHGGSSAHYFSLHDPKGTGRYATIVGMERDGKWYTRINTHFTSTQYRKRITEKYLPVSLPEGVRSKGNPKGHTAPCIFQHADGTEAYRGHWSGRRRGRSGEPSHPLILRDEDGAFVGHDTSMVSDLDLMGKVGDCEQMLGLGWFDAASRTRTDWLESIKKIPGSMCDHRNMLAVAARSYLVASRMTQQYPKMRMALFPAVACNPVSSAEENLHINRHGSDVTPQTVMYRKENGEPVLYYLPEVLLYWKERGKGCSSPMFVRLSMTIPPHGNPLLDPTGKSSFSSQTVRFPSQATGYWGSRVPLPLGYEQAYHSLLCWSESTPPRDRSGIFRDALCVPHPSSANVKQDAGLISWQDHKDKVLVKLRSELLSDLDVSLPLSMDTPVGMQPDDVASMFAEKMLLDSLPLC